jgi:hypothetical protein
VAVSKWRHTVTSQALYRPAASVSDPYTYLVAIQENPDDGSHWLAMPVWYLDAGRTDEAHAIRIVWPVLRDCLDTVPLEESLKQVETGAVMFGNIAKHIEARKVGSAADGSEFHHGSFRVVSLSGAGRFFGHALAGRASCAALARSRAAAICGHMFS